MSSKIDFVKNEVLTSGTDDWVHESEVCFAARQALFGEQLGDGFPDEETLDVSQLASLRAAWTAAQERQAFPLAIEAIKELISDGLVEIGSVTKNGFVPWGGSFKDVESRLDQVIDTARFPLLPGDLFWLSNTPIGDERAAA